MWIVNIVRISIMKLSFYYLKKKFLISQNEKETKKKKRKCQYSDRIGTKQLEKECPISQFLLVQAVQL